MCISLRGKVQQKFKLQLADKKKCNHFLYFKYISKYEISYILRDEKGNSATLINLGQLSVQVTLNISQFATY